MFNFFSTPSVTVSKTLPVLYDIRLTNEKKNTISYTDTNDPENVYNHLKVSRGRGKFDTYIKKNRKI